MATKNAPVKPEASTPDTQVISTTHFSLIEGEGSRNYLKAQITGQPADAITPFLLSRDGKLYVRKSDVPAGTKGYIVTVAAIV